MLLMFATDDMKYSNVVMQEPLGHSGFHIAKLAIATDTCTFGRCALLHNWQSRYYDVERI